MKLKLIPLLLVCLFGAVSMYAQTFYKPSGFTLDPQYAHAMASTGDGGAIMTGLDATSQSIFVVKTDINDNVMWDFTYKVAGLDIVPKDIIAVGGEGYLISGQSYTYPFSPVRLMISPSGSVMWGRRAAGNNRGLYFKSYYDFNQGKIVSVGAMKYGSNPYTYLVSSIKPDGTAAIDKVVTINNNTEIIAARDLVRTFDGGLLVVGSRFVTNDAYDQVYAVKLAPVSYAPQWVKKYKDQDNTFSLQATTVGAYYDFFSGQHGYIIGGVNENEPTTLLPDEGFMYRINLSGSPVWGKTYTRPIEDLNCYWYGGIHATGTDDGHPFISQHGVNDGATFQYKEYSHQFATSTQSQMMFTEIQLRFNPGAIWPSGLRAGGYYNVGTKRLVSMNVDYNLDNACNRSPQETIDYGLQLQVTEPPFAEFSLNSPIPLSFYSINRTVNPENCGNMEVDISGTLEACYEFIGMFPITLTATSSHPNTIFTWQIPPGFSGTVSGTNNQFMTITGAPQPPLFGSITDYFWVTGSYSGGVLTATTNQAFTVIYCDGRFEKTADTAPIEQITLFPNPAKSKVSVRIPDAGLPAQVQIMTLEGKVVQSREIHVAESQFELDGLSKGLYLVEVQGNLGRFVEKLIVQ